MRGLQVSISLWLLNAFSLVKSEETLTIVPQKSAPEDTIDVNDLESIEESYLAFIAEEEAAQGEAEEVFRGFTNDENPFQRSVSVTDSNHRNGSFF